MSNETVKKWCIRADHDLKIGKDEMLTDDASTDMICFHMQQCVEKYLKAFMIAHGKEITKTHILSLLIQQCIEIDEDFNGLFEIEADRLTMYAVEVRYPDDFYMPSIEETDRAIEIAEFARRFVREKLGLEGESNAMSDKEETG